MRWRTLAAAALALALVTSPAGSARAAEKLVWFFQPGVIISVGVVGHKSWAIGPNASLVASFGGQYGAGVYSRLEIGRAREEGSEHRFLLRPAGGLQAHFIAAGAEIGAGYAPFPGERAGLDVAPFLSLGIVWSGFRFTFPGTKGAFDGDVLFGAQAPLVVSGSTSGWFK